MEQQELHKRLNKASKTLNTLTLSCIGLNHAICNTISAIDSCDDARIVNETISMVGEAFSDFGKALELFVNAANRLPGGKDYNETDAH